MNKQEYAKQLLSRLAYMINENEIANKIYKQLQFKIPAFQVGSNAHWEALNKLSEKDYNIYNKMGMIYSKSALQRVRIELNTILIEIEKGE